MPPLNTFVQIAILLNPEIQFTTTLTPKVKKFNNPNVAAGTFHKTEGSKLCYMANKKF